MHGLVYAHAYLDILSLPMFSQDAIIMFGHQRDEIIRCSFYLVTFVEVILGQTALTGNVTKMVTAILLYANQSGLFHHL